MVTYRSVKDKFNSVTEKYPRGRRGSPAKGVVCVKRSEGSNPSFSANENGHLLVSIFRCVKKKGDLN